MGPALQRLVSFLLTQLPKQLAKVDRKVLVEIAEALGSKLGIKVSPTASAIMVAIRSAVQSNPKIAYIVANIMTVVGMTALEGLVSDAASEDSESPFVKAAVSAFQVKLREQRALHTGDGSASTVNGGRADGTGFSTSERLEAEDMIDTAIRIIGNPELFMILRTVMFMEDADIEAYIKSQR